MALLEAEGLTGPLPRTGSAHTLLLARCALRRARGEIEEALADAREAERRETLRPGVGLRPLATTSLALTFRAADEGDTALKIARRQLRWPGGVELPSHEGAGLLVLGMVEGGSNGIDHLAQAVSLLERVATQARPGPRVRRIRRCVEACEPSYGIA